MLPYMLNWKDYMNDNKTIKPNDAIVPEVLQHSSNAMEVQSWYLNHYLAQEVEKAQQTEKPLAMIVHHYYTAQTKFP